MITIVDYGLGNVRAFSNMYQRMNIETRLAKSPADLEDATRIILPGVGAFDHAMARLEMSGMRHPLDTLVRERRVPLLGVCVGMQMLAQSSDEGRAQGLGWIPGRVRAFKAEEKCTNLPLPHMGWNNVHPTQDPHLFRGLEHDARFYFLHSFFFDCERNGDAAATTQYGVEFACAVHSANVFGVQFHPEKSHHYGAMLLKNFAQL